jgi:hypothetical protein
MIEIDDRGVRRRLANGTVEQVVPQETTESGPLLEKGRTAMTHEDAFLQATTPQARRPTGAGSSGADVTVEARAGMGVATERVSGKSSPDGSRRCCR